MLNHVTRTYTAITCIEKERVIIKEVDQNYSQAAACKTLEVLNLTFTVCVELKEGNHL